MWMHIYHMMQDITYSMLTTTKQQQNPFSSSNCSSQLDSTCSTFSLAWFLDFFVSQSTNRPSIRDYFFRITASDGQFTRDGFKVASGNKKSITSHRFIGSESIAALSNTQNLTIALQLSYSKCCHSCDKCMVNTPGSVPYTMSVEVTRKQKFLALSTRHRYAKHAWLYLVVNSRYR